MMTRLIDLAKKHGVWLVLICLLVGLVVVWVVRPELFTWQYWDAHSGGKVSKSELVRNLGLLAFGVIGVLFGIWRTSIAQQQTDIAERGHFTDRFTAAIEHLGNEQLPVRLGGIHALWRIARDAPDDNVKRVLDILCAYVRHPPHPSAPVQRRETGSTPDADTGSATETLPDRIVPDVQTILDLTTDPSPQIREIIPDHYSFDFFGANLGGADLDGADLDGADLDGADLDGADLRKANLGGANLSGANLDGANLGGAYLREANLSGANLDGANLGGAYLREANLSGVDLRKTNLDGADLSGASLGGAYLSGASLGGTNLGGAYLREAYLRKADLGGADLSGADLSRGYLSGADLRKANLDGAYLREANLGGTNLGGADLRKANLRKADLSGADLPEVTGLTQGQLDEAVADPDHPPKSLPDGLIWNDRPPDDWPA